MASAIDDYIAAFPSDARIALQQVRQTIAAVMPDAQEAISYQIPTFKINGSYVIYFAGYKKHVSIYPLTSECAGFENEVAPYRSGRATVKFPLNVPMPLPLIEKIAAFMHQMHKARVAKKSKEKVT